jgi:hypothetical protein
LDLRDKVRRLSRLGVTWRQSDPDTFPKRKGFGAPIQEGFHLKRFHNGAQARQSNIYANLSAEWWSVVGQLIERRAIVIPGDERLSAQLTSRRKLYDSKGREKLEPKDDLASRGVESPDRADALIGAVMMGIGGDPYALNPNSRKLDLELMRDSLQRDAGQ